MVIFYLHGGGYMTSQPVSYLIFLLKLAESIIVEGRTVSIFALDYWLAPESAFPAQLGDASNAWAYLTEEMGVDMRRVVLVGDSAGGHLALSFLVNLRNPIIGLGESRSVIETRLPIPAGLVLISHSKSHRRKAHSDVLTGHFLLDIAASRLLGCCYGYLACGNHTQYGAIQT